MVVFLCVFGARIAAAQEVSACVNPAGQLRLVAATEACRAQEQRVVWNVQGPQGPQGIQGPQGAQGEQGESAAGGLAPAVVVDSLAQVVGHLMGADGNVLVTVGNDRFFAKVTKGGFARGGILWYANSVCDGTAFMPGTLTPNAIAQPAIVNGSTAWVVDAAAAVAWTPAPGNVLALSRRTIDPNTGVVGPCLAFSFGAVAVWPLKPVDVGHFLPPFAIQ